MLMLLFAVLVALWFVGIVTRVMLGGLVHLLLVAAAAVLVARIVRRRKAA